ncbi:aquaporin-5-like [Haliotis rubra]|uniref:aquaporin-5-like n=1 Tax=Haliotis rubra TaxID=36100 RepID=UPI001EE50D82|nr:aquaporin-5-like [Haliotis rubra]
MSRKAFAMDGSGDVEKTGSRYSMLNPLRNLTNISDCTFPQFPKALFAEFLGTAILVIFGCGSALTVEENLKPNVVSIAIAFGLTVATVIWALGHVSGAQINPCVAVAMCLTRKMTFAKALAYSVTQCGGAVVGGYILYALTPAGRRGNLGVTLVHSEVGVWQAVGVEFLATFVLILGIFATCDSRISDHPGSKALSIGLVVTMDIPWAAQYTGASMNSARSFGPALVMGIWDHHWVYWLGPMLGGIAAGLVYDQIFAVNSSLLKTKEWLGSRDYDEDRIYRYMLSRDQMTKRGSSIETQPLSVDINGFEEGEGVWQSRV